MSGDKAGDNASGWKPVLGLSDDPVEPGSVRLDWRERAATQFACEKQPAQGRSGMVVSNHPLASAAGNERPTITAS